VGEIDESNVHVCGDIAVDSGTCTFHFADDGEVHARFPFVYHRTGDPLLRAPAFRTPPPSSRGCGNAESQGDRL
jgi:hypothetical protein